MKNNKNYFYKVKKLVIYFEYPQTGYIKNDISKLAII